ncbi:hypothetical protein BZG36_05552 [Bifiguratus adelaidae]|uniref:Zn(2)-C6 fungal-type domain-containing protein n=1 Tax=Bifiguratus adelaidae TaxID=1938954 RepID=A0A261XT51_9FUNG|nr:hypothetical protein BZG36_05552 [Bifiguratus adelaidae]
MASQEGGKLDNGAACYRCRGFRHACDRKKPSCSRCQRRGINCVYPEAAPTLKKLQKATETLGERLKKFGDRLKGAEAGDLSGLPRLLVHENGIHRAASSFSIYPCSKCFRDLQPCDLSIPRCARCTKNNFECQYQQTEPKASHVAQVLNTMNRVVDGWQESLDKMAKDVSKKTREFGAKANTLVTKPRPPFTTHFKQRPNKPFNWRITSTSRGLSMDSSVTSFDDLSKLVEQFKNTLRISPPNYGMEDLEKKIDFETESDRGSIISSAPFANIWGPWNSVNSLPPESPLSITQQLTDNLVLLFLRTPCCSSIRIPVINTTTFLDKYNDRINPPSDLLVASICAMSARNAFQIHVWSEREDKPRHNMGKVLSVAYCAQGRELFADCFDSPSVENVQSALFLSYCNQQNGNASVIYIYEWIGFSLAQSLGMYDHPEKLNSDERLLLWSMYYFHAWSTILTGTATNQNQIIPNIPLPAPPPASSVDPEEHQIKTVWYHMIKLQLFRQDLMAQLTAAEQQMLDQSTDAVHGIDILSLQSNLQCWHSSLPAHWRDPDVTRDSSAALQRDFESFCILFIHVNYCINKILLYQGFIPQDHLPSRSFALQCLTTCLQAAHTITCILDVMVTLRNDCNIPLLAFSFSNSIYAKLLNYPDERFTTFARRCIRRNLSIAKRSTAFLYDFELSSGLVKSLEGDVEGIDLDVPLDESFTRKSFDASTLGSASIPYSYDSSIESKQMDNSNNPSDPTMDMNDFILADDEDAYMDKAEDISEYGEKAVWLALEELRVKV